MKFSENWLRQWVNPNITSAQLAKQLTMAGLEVDAIENLSLPAEVRIAEILEAQPHPNADRLRVCKVNIGEETPLTIVCGAANARAGLKAPLAMVGAVLGDLTIKKAKIRDVESFGMLCSASELGLEETSSGLLELAEDAPVGKSLAEYLQLPDQIIDVDLTPNRGDCLSIAGIAREVGVINRLAVNPVAIPEVQKSIPDTLPVKLLAAEHCPRYVGRIIRGIRTKAQTPIWMIERLRRSGIRSINPVVDVCNYVMLELGQPMHGFDLSAVSQEIRVRMAKAGEKITLLDGKEIELNTRTLVIADAEQPLAIAGVMGGVSSSVTQVTQDIFLESAFFNPQSIASASRSFQLFSDSSSRFERGVDPQLQIKALNRATELLLEIVGGKPGKIIEVTSEVNLPKQPTIKLRRERILRILGIKIADETVVEILNRLGMQTQVQQDGWEVLIPSYRFDINIEVDLIEELARIYGYTEIPNAKLQGSLNILPDPEQTLSLSKVRQLLVDKAYTETINYSFVDPKLETLLNPRTPALTLINPISSDMAVMRTGLWSSLISCALFNLNRQQSRIRIFETGLCFYDREGHVIQEPRVAGLVTGSVYPEQWGLENRPVDFFDMKNDVEALLQLTGKQARFEAAEHPALHPGQSAAISLDGKKIGYLGQLHPQIQQTLEIDAPVYLFALNWNLLKSKTLTHYQMPSKYPSVRRDIAIIVEENVPIQQIRDTIATSAGELLKQLQLFDIYQGEGIDSGKKSVALGLIFQLDSRTLVDKEIDDAVQKVIQQLEHAFNAILRA
jgi:phenylalanyl-tRNA synthetase beta chain